jgi:hypothetical protein
MGKLNIHVYIIFSMVMVVCLGMAANKQRSDCIFRAKLLGNEEIPPVKTKAKGDITFKFNRGEDDLTYKLTLTDIEEVTAADIRVGRKGMNGGPIVTLLTEPRKLEVSGALYAEGKIAAYQLLGSLKGESLDRLLQMMKAEETYVSVSTKRYPDGEIRGQIELIEEMKR